MKIFKSGVKLNISIDEKFIIIYKNSIHRRKGAFYHSAVSPTCIVLGQIKYVSWDINGKEICMIELR